TPRCTRPRKAWTCFLARRRSGTGFLLVRALSNSCDALLSLPRSVRADLPPPRASSACEFRSCDSRPRRHAILSKLVSGWSRHDPGGAGVGGAVGAVVVVGVVGAALAVVDVVGLLRGVVVTVVPGVEGAVVVVTGVVVDVAFGTVVVVAFGAVVVVVEVV